MFNRWNRWEITMAMLLLAGLCGCDGATIPWENSNGIIGGSITVEGSELLNLDGSGTPGALDASKIGVRVIEPIVDIDSVEIETSGSTLVVTPVSPGTAKLLEVQLLVAADLDGTGAASTPVTLGVPISVVTDQLTSVNLQVTLEQDGISLARASSQAGRPWFVRLRYTIGGPGAVTRHLRIRWQDRLVQYDSDRNDNFDDEDSFSDSDRDGLSDGFRDMLDDIVQNATLRTASGEIASFNLLSHEIVLTDGTHLRITEITDISLNGSASRIGALRIGDSVQARGYGQSAALLRCVEIAAQRSGDTASRR